MPKNRCRIK